MPSDEPVKLGFASPSAYAQAQHVLAQAHYTSAGIAKTLGAHAPLILANLPICVERTSPGRPLDTLIRLFHLGVPVAAAAAETALAPMTLDQWRDAGLIDLVAGHVTPRFLLNAFDHLVCAVDLTGPLHTAHGPGHVMPIASCSAILASFTIRRPVGRALDLGCGSGVQSLLLARHAGHVTGVDCNPRALALARFNALLNGVTNVTFLEGNWLSPVANDRFDAIVSVPPYVVSPRSQFAYRDGGHDEDGLCRELLRRSAGLLNENGFCQMFIDWVHVVGQPWETRLQSWLSDLGCDAWVIRLETVEPAIYASRWNTSEFSDAEKLLEVTEQWQAYYREHRIEAISSGIISLRRQSGRSNWMAFKDPPDRFSGSCGDALLRQFQCRDLLQRTDDRELLQWRPRYAEGVRLTQELSPGPQGWRPVTLRLSAGGSWVYSCRTEPAIAEALIRCDGQTPLATIVQDLATRTGVDAVKMASALCPMVREMVEFGVILPESR